MKNFKDEFEQILNRIKSKKPLAVTRYGDGEMIIFQNRYIDLTSKNTGEYKFDPTSSEDQKYRINLIESFRYKQPFYITGIGCPCCVGNVNFQWMKNFSGKTETELTWANIFVNANYPSFENSLINDEFKNHKVVLVCNKHASFNNLPFKLEKDFRVGTNAWKEDIDLVDEMKNWIGDKKDYLFLFAAGPFANILVHKLFKYNSNNMYLNIGSTMDNYIGLGKTRGYLHGADTLQKVCIWGS